MASGSGALAAFVVAALVALAGPGASAEEVCSDPGFSLDRCRQLEAISDALGKSACGSKRDFYSCIKREGCYDSPDSCFDDSGDRISCRDLCELEPGLAFCVDTQERTDPEDDYHLCPHIPKALFSRPPPTQEELDAAVRLPFSVAVWTAVEREQGSAPPSSVLPALMAPAVARAAASVFGLFESTVEVEEPVEYRDQPLTLDGETEPPAWVEQTNFFVVNFLVVDPTQQEATRSMLQRSLVGADAENITELSEGLLMQLRAELPIEAKLQLSAVGLLVASGRVEGGEFPAATGMTELTTRTTTLPPSLKRRLWQAWRLRCLAPVPYRWEVVELQLWTNGCPWIDGGGELLRPSPGGPAADGGGVNGSLGRSLLPISSGDAIADSGADAAAFDAAKAFDNGDGAAAASASSWLSSCRGCAAGEAWVGLEGSAGSPFAVSCATVKQSTSPSGQCSNMALEATGAVSDPESWEARATTEGFAVDADICVPRLRSDYPLLECGTLDNVCGGSIDFSSCADYNEECVGNMCRCTGRTSISDPQFADWECGSYTDGCGGLLDFGDCSASAGGGGVECSADHVCVEETPAAVLWRLVCDSGTSGRWWVREVEFHTEGFCFRPYGAFRQSISSGTYSSQHPAVNAFDGDEATMWGSMCTTCPPRQAWVGVDFGVQVRVACLRLLQGSRAVNRCPRLVLEYSDDGRRWLERARFGFGSHAIGVDEILQMDTDATVDDAKLHPAERSATFWRLACTFKMMRPWGVVELEFLEDAGCSVPLRPAYLEVTSSISGPWPSSNAFDGFDHSVWKSNCGSCTRTDATCVPCELNEAWIGVQLSQPVQVGCVRLQQLEPERGGCPAITLQFSETGTEGSWIVRESFRDTPAFVLLVPSQSVEQVTDQAPRRRGAGAALAVGAIALLLLHPIGLRLGGDR